MFVIGLTGGIGTGKSEVSAILAELGAMVIDADLLGHEAYRAHTDGWRDVVEAFGRGVLAPGGEVDRQKLAAIVFSDEKERRRLNRIVHPRIRRMLEERIRQWDERGKDVVVIEAAVLIEADWSTLVDEVWVTTAPEEQVGRRLQARSGLSDDQVRARIRSQMSPEVLAARADAVMDNSTTVEDLREHVLALWKSRVLDHKERDPHT